MSASQRGIPRGLDPFGLIGQHLAGRYTVLALLGEGGMGAVYRGEHRTLGARCALKVIRPEIAAAARLSGKERFLREARIGAYGIDGIPEVYDVDEHPTPMGPLSFLAMELLEGRSLGDSIARNKIEWRWAFHIAAQATRPLEAAYDWAGIVHRDLKPDNLFLCNDGRVMVLDFGIAHLGDGTGKAITKTGVIVGTPQYFSREQALAVSDLDTRADIYSLGATLYHALTQRPVFPTENVCELLVRLATGAPIDIREHAPALPEHAAQVIRRAMAPEREERYATMGELRSALEGAIRGESPAATSRAIRSSPDMATDSATRTVEAGPEAVTVLGPKDDMPATIPPHELPTEGGADVTSASLRAEAATAYSPVVPTPAEIIVETTFASPSRRPAQWRFITVAIAGSLLVVAGSFLLARFFSDGGDVAVPPSPSALETPEPRLPPAAAKRLQTDRVGGTTERDQNPNAAANAERGANMPSAAPAPPNTP